MTMIPVKELVIYPLSQCNLDCSHCYRSKEENELSIDDLKWISQTFSPKKTIIMGGEPFLYDNLKYVFDIFPNITISTNATLIKKNIKLLKKYRKKIVIQVSLEGGKKETNEVRGDNIWDTCMRSVELLKENNVRCYFRCSYHRDNLEQIKEEVFKEASFYKIGLMLLPRIDLPSLSASEQTDFFKTILDHDTEVLKDINDVDMDSLMSKYALIAVAQPHFFQFIGKKGRCGAGDERISIYFDKRVTPCNFDLDYTLGRVGDKEEKIKDNMSIFVENFKIPPIECAGCPNSDICKGSCYISKSYLGCPLRYNLDLGNLIMHDRLDEVEVRNDMNLLIKYVRNLGIC